jgi:hypothetical protein
LIDLLHCDGAEAGGRLELRPPVESSDLDEKVLTNTPVRDTFSVRIWVRVKVASVTYFPPYREGVNRPDRKVRDGAPPGEEEGAG